MSKYIPHPWPKITPEEKNRRMEKARERAKQWYKSHPDRVAERARAWFLSHPQRKKEIHQKWNKENPALKAANSAARRALKIMAQPQWVDKKIPSGFLC